MEHTMGMAARAASVSKATIHRAISSGRLSARRLDDGSYRIDASELARVWPKSAGVSAETVTSEVSRDDTKPEAKQNEIEVAVLRVKLDAAEAALLREREIADDLRLRLGQALTLLAAPRVAPDPVSPQPSPPVSVSDSTPVAVRVDPKSEPVVEREPSSLEPDLEPAHPGPPKDAAQAMAAAITRQGGVAALLSRLFGRG